MDAPELHFASSDGYRIAHWAVGDGFPIVLVPYQSDANLQWSIPELGEWIERLSEEWRVVGFDPRGTGASTGTVGELSFADWASDLDAVASALDLNRFALFGNFWSGAEIATRYVIAHPGSVSHLILANPGREYSPLLEVLRELGRMPGRRTLAQHTNLFWRGWERHESREALIAIQRRRDERTDARIGVLTTPPDADLTLDSLTIPVLVVAREHALLNFAERASEFAATLPNATFKLLPGHAADVRLGDHEPLCGAIRSLLAGDGEEDLVGGLRTILFTDLEASTPLTQRLGDEGAQEILRGHNETVRAALRDHGGREVKHTGDGIMATFPSAVAAVTAALQIQRELSGGEVRVRVGLNAGEPIAEDNDLFGLSVIKAARIADRAEPGQVLVSRVVRELCEGKTFQFSSLGEVSLKGFEETMELFEVSSFTERSS